MQTRSEAVLEKLKKVLDFAGEVDKVVAAAKREAAANLYKNGWPVHEIAQKVHISPTAIYEGVDAAGVPRRRRKGSVNGGAQGSPAADGVDVPPGSATGKLMSEVLRAHFL